MLNLMLLFLLYWLFNEISNAFAGVKEKDRGFLTQRKTIYCACTIYDLATLPCNSGIRGNCELMS